MTRTIPSHTGLSLEETWIAQTLEGRPIGDVPQQVLARVDGRRVCLMVVAGDGSDDAWVRYSRAAARRVAATGDRLRPLAASGRTDDCFFVVYDIGQAEPLYSNGEPAQLPSAQCVQLLHGVGRGLEQAAAAGLYASELSPESVFVDPTRGAVLADMGVAREALGRPGGLDPRAPWVAPEVLAGERATEPSSVYSFGALMYTLLTGAPPRQGGRAGRLGAEPPSIRERRPDLPEAFETVVSTALAADPRRRYRSVSETRSLATILLQGDLVPDAKAERGAIPGEAPKPRRRIPQAVALGRRSEVAIAPPRRRPRSAEGDGHGVAFDAADNGGPQVVPAAAWAERARHLGSRVQPALGALPRLALALAAGALILGALAGLLLAGGGSDQPQAPRALSRDGLQLRLPADWKAGPAAGGALSAHPADDPRSALSLEVLDAPVERAEQGNPVRLGGLEAWREPQADVVGARAAVRYVFPTESGKLIATCRASQRAAPRTLSTCERVLSTLRLRSATGLPIAAVVEQQKRWQAEVARLGRERAAARAKLAAAELPAGQRVAADALGRVHDRAAGRFAALPGGEAVAQAARRTASAYRALALVADGESAVRWQAALARVRRSEASLRAALADAE